MDTGKRIRVLPPQAMLSLSPAGDSYQARVFISSLTTARQVQSLGALLEPNAWKDGGAFVADLAHMAAASAWGATLLDEFLTPSGDTTCSYYHREFRCGGCPIIVACSLCGSGYCSTECWTKDHRENDEHSGETRLVCPYEPHSVFGFGALPLTLVGPTTRVEQIILLDEDEDLPPSDHDPYLVTGGSADEKRQLLVYMSPRGLKKFGARFPRIRLEPAPPAAAAAESFGQAGGPARAPSPEKKAKKYISELKGLRKDFLKNGADKEKKALCSWWKRYAEEPRPVIAAALSDALVALDAQEFLLVCGQLGSVWEVAIQEESTTDSPRKNILWIRPATNVLDMVAELRLEPGSAAATLAFKIVASFQRLLSRIFMNHYLPALWKLLARHSDSVIASKHFARAQRRVCAQTSNPGTLQARREKTEKTLAYFVDNTVQALRAEHKTGAAQSLAYSCLMLFRDVCAEIGIDPTVALEFHWLERLVAVIQCRTGGQVPWEEARYVFYLCLEMNCSFSASRVPERVYFDPLRNVNLFLYSRELVEQGRYSPPEVVDMIFLRLKTLLHGLEETTRDCGNSTREQLRGLLSESVELLDQVLGTVEEAELLLLVGRGIERLGFDLLKNKARGQALGGLIYVLALHAANPALARSSAIVDSAAELATCKQLLALVVAGNFAR